jgi:dCTP deaminase
MSVLSDRTIRLLIASSRISIDPLEPALVQPASIDIRLGYKFRVFHNARYAYIDVADIPEDLTRLVDAEPDRHGPFMINPSEFVLGRSLEIVGLPNDIVARLEGKSSLGRLGLLIHSTAGFIDPGFRGSVTLELSNVANLPIKLYPGMLIGQLSFMSLDQPAEAMYGDKKLGSKYQGQIDPEASKMHLNFEEER